MAAMLQTILLIVLTNTISSNTPPPPTYSNALILCAPSKQCVINCPNKNHCTNKTIICPSHQNCIITCHAPHSCSNTTIIANHSSHLTIHALSAYSTTHSNIYCPSSASSRCQIYAHSPSNNQWNNMNLHINTHTNLTLSCHCHSNQECANDASISLTKHHNNSYTKCLLSNRNYKCIPTHSQMRTLLSITTPIPNNITLTTKPVHTSHTSPFGIQLTATQISCYVHPHSSPPHPHKYTHVIQRGVIRRCITGNVAILRTDMSHILSLQTKTTQTPEKVRILHTQ